MADTDKAKIERSNTDKPGKSVLKHLIPGGMKFPSLKKKSGASGKPSTSNEQDASISTDGSKTEDSARNCTPKAEEVGAQRSSGDDGDKRAPPNSVGDNVSQEPPGPDGTSKLVDSKPSDPPDPDRTTLPTHDESPPVVSLSPGTDAESLWDAAYSSLNSEFDWLIDAYERMIADYLERKSPGGHSGMENDTERRSTMSRVIYVWLTDYDSSKTTISDEETHMGEVDRSLRDILRRSLERSGYISLPWAAACLSVENIFGQNSISEADRSGIIQIVSKMEWYICLSRLLLNYSDGNIGQMITAYYPHRKDKVLGLYAAILRFTIEQSLALTNQRPRWELSSSDNSTRQRVFDLEEDLIEDLRGSTILSHLGQLLDRVRLERHLPEGDDGIAEVKERLNNIKAKLQPIETPSLKAEVGGDNLLRHMHYWAAETEEYKSFFQRHRGPDEIGCGVLWVSGPAGAGKTMLIQATIQQLLEEAEAIANTDDKFNLAYFFCDSREQTGSCATEVIKSLIWQMLKSQPSLATHMENKFHTTGRDIFNDPNDFYAMSTVLYDMLNDTDHGNGEFGLTYVIVDAIEELSVDNDPAGTLHADSAVRNLLGLILNTTKVSQHIKWLVSIDPSKLASELTPIDGSTKLGLDIGDERYSKGLEGIIAGEYIPSKVCEVARSLNFRKSFQSEVTGKLRAVAPRNFLWVNTACHRIKSHGLPWNAIRILDELPKDVNGLYREAYKMLDNLGYTEDRDTCRDILFTTAIAYRALSESEAGSLLGLPENVDLNIMVTNMCSSFLEMYNGRVCYVHSSARDFIRKILIDDEAFSSKHLGMTRRCLKHAILGGKSQSGRYATVNWIRHMWAACSGEDGNDVFQIANDFFESHFLEWTEALAKHGLLPEAIILLQRLNTSLKKKMGLGAPTEQLHYWLKNVEQALWLLNFHQSIKSLENLSPKYSFPFLPSKSELRQKLLPNALPWLEVAPDIQAGARVGSIVQVLKGHSDWVRCCCYSPDGRLIASGGDDGVVRLWDAETFKMQHTFDLGRYVYQVLFTSDQHLVVVTGTTIQIWNALTGARLKTPGLMGGYDDVHSSDGKKLVASRDQDVIILSNPDGDGWSESILERPDKVAGIACVRSSPDGALIAYTIGEVVFLWDIQSSKERHLPGGHSYYVRGLDFSHDSKYLASCSGDETVRVWDIHGETCNSPSVLTGHKNTVYCVSFSPDGLHLASGSADSTIIIWGKQLDGSNPAPLYTIEKVLRGHSDTIYSLSFEPDGQQLISSSFDKTVIVWDISTQREPDASQNELEPSPRGHDTAVSFMAFSPNGLLFASASSSGEICLWDCNDGHLLKSFTEHYSDVTWLDFSYNGRTLVSASNDMTARVWDTNRGVMNQRLLGNRDWVRCAVISPNGKLVASASDDRSVRVWNIEGKEGDNKTHRLFQGDEAHGDYVRVVAFSPDGTHLVSGGDDFTIIIWDLENGDGNKESPDFSIPNASEDIIHGLAFTKDGERFMSCEVSGVIRVWNSNTRTCEHILDSRSPSAPFRTIQFVEGLVDVLMTEIGAWPITIHPPSSTASTSQPDTNTASLTESRLDRETPPDRCPYGISNDRKWITWNNKNLIYLPTQYRPSGGDCVACRVHDRMVVIGSESGKVLFFKFSADRGPAHEDNIIGYS